MEVFLVLFCFFPHIGKLILGPCFYKKRVTVMGLSQNVELTARKWFSDNNCVQAMTLSHCCNNSLWKAYHTPTPLVASWMAGETKAGVSCLPLTLRAACTCSWVTHWAAERTPFREQPEANGSGPFPLYKQEARALTHWVCQEEALRWLSAECIPPAGGDCLHTEQCTETGQLRQNEPSAQPTRSALRKQLGWLLHLPDP